MNDDLAAFLGRGGTGVLALARDDTPYAVPVSYGHNPAEGTFTLRLGVTPDSEKTRFLDRADAPEARLVVYGRDDDRWTSVVATGRLHEVSADDLTPAVAETLRGSDPPLLDVWPNPGAVEFRLYRLDPDDVSVRRTEGSERAGTS